MKRVKFLKFYQGQHTYPHAYSEGQEGEVSDEAAADLIERGIAVAVKAAKGGSDAK